MRIHNEASVLSAIAKSIFRDTLDMFQIIRILLQIIPGSEVRQLLKNNDTDIYAPRFVTPICDLLIDGFPRSANTYLYYKTQLTFPSIKIAHHIHSWQHFLFSKLFRVYSILIIREPDSAVNSLHTKRKGYKSLYYTEYILSNILSIFLADKIVLFSEIIDKNSLEELILTISCILNKETTDLPEGSLKELMNLRTNKKNTKTPAFDIEQLSLISKGLRKLALIVFKYACKKAEIK